MNTFLKELDGSDFSFLKEIISEFNGQMISDSDLQNRITFIMNREEAARQFYNKLGFTKTGYRFKKVCIG
jgi:hypothetical protein